VGLAAKFHMARRFAFEPDYRGFLLQRLMTDIDDRERKADEIARSLPQLEGVKSPEVTAQANELKEHGFVFPYSSPLRPEWVVPMREYFKANKCSNPYRPDLGEFIAPEGAPKGTHIAMYPAETMLNAPHALEIANDPAILAIVADMLGCRTSTVTLTICGL
jgi:hypothetical protein